ncbi:MAG: hypothetical protein KIT11_09290 [Fimbriimonadaceae bacterium]|nr:hypothetical protein [Fimbriimonadaceae bacterium]QYK55521.1 MAG: hypothetical protein KF733_10960 [Fimbriimonadaceae bacterium]
MAVALLAAGLATAQQDMGRDMNRDDKDRKGQDTMNQQWDSGPQKMWRPMNAQQLEQLTASWPREIQNVAREMSERYGAPDSVTSTSMMWYGNGPWAYTLLTSDPVPHNFPTPHDDFLMSAVEFKVPDSKVSDLARLNGSLIWDKTSGILAARCNSEAMNFLAINVAREVVDGKKSVKEARAFMAYAADEYIKNRGRDDAMASTRYSGQDDDRQDRNRDENMDRQRDNNSSGTQMIDRTERRYRDTGQYQDFTSTRRDRTSWQYRSRSTRQGTMESAYFGSMDSKLRDYFTGFMFDQYRDKTSDPGTSVRANEYRTNWSDRNSWYMSGDNPLDPFDHWRKK